MDEFTVASGLASICRSLLDFLVTSKIIQALPDLKSTLTGLSQRVTLILTNGLRIVLIGHLRHIWLSRGGFVVTADYGMVCYDGTARPVTAPTEEDDKYWQTPDDPNDIDHV